MNNEKLSEIIGLIDEGALVLTVNKRLSRYILATYDHVMESRGHMAWKTPVVMPIGSWLLELWNSEPSGIRFPALGHGRARVLWDEIISGDKTLAPGEARLARSVAETSFMAYVLIHEYGIRLPERIYLNLEAEAHRRWSGEYERRLKALGFTDPSRAALGATGLIKKGLTDLPRKVVLAGFDELTPLNRSVVEGLEKTGSEVVFWPRSPIGPTEETSLELHPDKITVIKYPDVASEVEGVARWIRKTLKPGMTIGVIVPELSRYRSIISREFSAELDPRSVLPGSSDNPVFNISLGGSLVDEPLVAAALAILKVDGWRMSVYDITKVLLSPYLSFRFDDYLTAAKIDFELKDGNRTTTSLEEVKRILEGSGSGKGLAGRLSGWLTAIEAQRRRREPPGVWAEEFSTLLNTVGFAKGLILSSGELQALEKLHELLDEFSGLDDITGPMTRASAVDTLRNLASGTIHQPESPGAPIQVLGLLESTGQYFDHIVILGCHEYAMPATPSPNPFIPAFVQKKAGLPGSSHEQSHRFARVVLSRLTESAGDITVTYPATVEDRPMGVSPFFKSVKTLGADLEEINGARLRDTVFSAGGLEEMPGEGDIPVSAEEIKCLRGGTLILRDFSACPFRAYAAHRLRAVAVKVPEIGLTAMERGTLVHEALKAFWQKVRDSITLKGLMSSGEVDRHIRRAAAEAFKGITVDPPLSRKYLDIEKERLVELIAEWLHLEKERTGFAVRHLEKWVNLDLKGLPVRGRVDRVDEVEYEGDRFTVIIDYKTGRTSRNDWLFSRPRDPQLPAYTTAENLAKEGFDAVAFADVRPGECRFSGVARADGLLPGVVAFEHDGWKERVEGADDWKTLIELWRRTSEGLAEGFLKGVVAVDPRTGGGDNPCEYCEFTPLCRVFEMGVAIEAGENNDE